MATAKRASVISASGCHMPCTASAQVHVSMDSKANTIATDNSANSQGLQVHTLLNPDDSPSRNSMPCTPLSARVPISHQVGASQLPSLNQGFHEGPNRDSYGQQRDSLGRELNRDSYRDSRDLAPSSHLDSRRSSVDSRMHQGFNSLYINGPASPYESANTSQVSLAASLRRQPGQPISPLSTRSSQRGQPAPRIAPPIMPVGRGPGVPDPTAAKPTQGFAWAFPDSAIPEEERRGSDSGESSTHNPSRQNSFAASSVRSSIFSNDSHLPMGQRRFTEHGNSVLAEEYERRADMIAEPSTTHHHSLQHRTISGLQHEGLNAQGIGNYSRTPELRVSHKLAERKRRSEMKDLFEDLNKAVPQNGGTKASKWEILTKGTGLSKST